jgi:hypothetical protein
MDQVELRRIRGFRLDRAVRKGRDHLELGIWTLGFGCTSSLPLFFVPFFAGNLPVLLINKM